MTRDSTQKIDRVASEWLVQRDSGNWSDEDAAAFERWLNVSALNRVAFLRLEWVWEKTGRLKALAAGIRSETPPPPSGWWNLSPFYDADMIENLPSSPGGSPRLRDASYIHARVRNWVIAASLVVGIAIGASAWLLASRGQAYSTPVGGLALLPIRDGSKVTLNTNSQIRLDLTSGERRIELTRGEAFFEVAKDAKRPFVVEADKIRVVAVGTKFAVRREHGAIEVIVTEGKVRVEDASLPLRSKAVDRRDYTASGGAGDPVFLTSGAVAQVGDVGVLVQQKTIPEAEAMLSWRMGILTFRDETLADAIADFNQYTERKIIIKGADIAGLKIEGNIRVSDVSAFLELLQSGYPVRVIEEPNKILVVPK